MREYRIIKGWRILIYVLTSFSILLYGGLALMFSIPSFNSMTAQLNKSANGDESLLAILFLSMVVIMIVAIIATRKNRIEVTDQSIISIGLIKKTELKFDEIKGFNRQRVRINLIFSIDYISIIPISGKKKIDISSFIENRSHLVTFLNSKITNLDVVEFEVLQKKVEKEYQEILVNNNFGFSIEQRLNKLSKTRLISYILNGVGVFVTLWAIFFPRPYEYAIIICVILPLIILVVIKLSKGLIRVAHSNWSVYPDASYSLFTPGIALYLRAILDFSIDDNSNIWIPAIVITIIFTGILLLFNKHLSFKKGKDLFTICIFLPLIFIYGYGTILTTNCMFDKSEPDMFASEVLEKEISEINSYYLKLSPWGDKVEMQKVSVDSKLYNNLQVGEKVSVYRFKGKFNIPWLVVDQAR